MIPFTQPFISSLSKFLWSYYYMCYYMVSLVAQLVMNLPCNARHLGSIPVLGRSPGEGNGYTLQYSGLENSKDCIVHGVAMSRTRLSSFHFHYVSDNVQGAAQR